MFWHSSERGQSFDDEQVSQHSAETVTDGLGDGDEATQTQSDSVGQLGLTHLKLPEIFWHTKEFGHSLDDEQVSQHSGFGDGGMEGGIDGGMDGGIEGGIDGGRETSANSKTFSQIPVVAPSATNGT